MRGRASASAPVSRLAGSGDRAGAAAAPLPLHLHGGMQTLARAEAYGSARGWPADDSVGAAVRFLVDADAQWHEARLPAWQTTIILGAIQRPQKDVQSHGRSGIYGLTELFPSLAARKLTIGDWGLSVRMKETFSATNG